MKAKIRYASVTNLVMRFSLEKLKKQRKLAHLSGFVELGSKSRHTVKNFWVILPKSLGVKL